MCSPRQIPPYYCVQIHPQPCNQSPPPSLLLSGVEEKKEENEKPLRQHNAAETAGGCCYPSERSSYILSSGPSGKKAAARLLSKTLHAVAGGKQLIPSPLHLPPLTSDSQFLYCFLLLLRVFSHFLFLVPFLLYFYLLFPFSKSLPFYSLYSSSSQAKLQSFCPSVVCFHYLYSSFPFVLEMLSQLLQFCISIF